MPWIHQQRLLNMCTKPKCALLFQDIHCTKQEKYHGAGVDKSQKQIELPSTITSLHGGNQRALGFFVSSAQPGNDTEVNWLGAWVTYPVYKSRRVATYRKLRKVSSRVPKEKTENEKEQKERNEAKEKKAFPVREKKRSSSPENATCHYC